MTFILINQHIVHAQEGCLSPQDRGLTLGHGLFETMLVKQRSTPLLTFHWQRLVKSAALLNIKLPFSYQTLQDMITKLIAINELDNNEHGIRLTLTSGPAARGLIIPQEHQRPTVILSAFNLAPRNNEAFTASIVSTRRNEFSLASQCKSTSYLDNILAKEEATNQGVDEAILLNSKTNVAEGASSSLFIVKHSIIYTPSIKDGALPGIIRHIILHELKLNGLTVKEETVSTQQLIEADEVFITNALLRVKPIKQIGGKMLPLHSPITLHTGHAVEEYILKQVISFRSI